MRGEALARAWCANCHLVADNQDMPATADVPSFASMANDEAFTESRMSGFMRNPHPPMPDLSLSNDEVDDILAYIRTLKRR